jgi:hypothetical protein
MPSPPVHKAPGNLALDLCQKLTARLRRRPLMQNLLAALNIVNGMRRLLRIDEPLEQIPQILLISSAHKPLPFSTVRYALLQHPRSVVFHFAMSIVLQPMACTDNLLFQVFLLSCRGA